jgi:phosphoribosylanthranilate isomerase
MRLPWVKVCGITTPEAVIVAASAGVDAIGFVFAESPRRVTPERAYRLAAPVRGRLACCAVVRRTTQGEVDEILQVLRPDMLQVDVGELESLKLPRTLAVLPVVSTRRRAPEVLPETLLLERPPADDGAAWDTAGISRLSRQTRLVIAGGLDCANVAEVVQSLAPYGVDVSRGVEIAPGIKAHDRIRQFVKAARSRIEAIAL